MDTRRGVDLDTARRAFFRHPVARLATTGTEGPHVVPVWFVWDPDAVFCSIEGGTLTLVNVRTDPRVALVLDAGRQWEQLGGVVLSGRARLLRPEHPDLRGPMSRWYDKYRERFGPRGYRLFTENVPELWFVRIHPERVAWWDHGEGPFAALRDRD